MQLIGAWRMMTGRADGIRLLDLSADGFWNSFSAILLAIPALLPGWVHYADQLMPEPEIGARLSIILRVALTDLGTWVLPLVGLAIAARRAALADRFVLYVVATNWASVIFVWAMLPPTLLASLLPHTEQLASLLSLALIGATMVLTWRLTNAAIGKGAAVATAVFTAMFVAAYATLFALQALFGLSSVPS